MADTFFRVRVEGTLQGGEVWSINPCFASYIAPENPTDANMQDWLDAILAMNQGRVLPEELRGALSSSGAVTGARVEFYGADGKLQIAAEGTLAIAQPGSGTPNAPMTTAICASLITGRIGRSFRGRLYIPALHLDLVNPTLRVSNAQTTDVANGTASMLEAFAAAYPVAGRLEASVRSATRGINTEVTSVRVGNVPDNLRNRKDSLTEQYVAVVVDRNE